MQMATNSGTCRQRLFESKEIRQWEVLKGGENFQDRSATVQVGQSNVELATSGSYLRTVKE